jgi:hypothetical protein
MTNCEKEKEDLLKERLRDETQWELEEVDNTGIHTYI